MPFCFRVHYGLKVTAIIDCFELFIEKPSNLMARACIWSQYKHYNTACKLFNTSDTSRCIDQCFLIPVGILTDVAIDVVMDVPVGIVTDVPIDVVMNIPVGIMTDVPVDVVMDVPVGIVTNVPVGIVTNVPVDVVIDVPVGIYSN